MLEWQLDGLLWQLSCWRKNNCNWSGGVHLLLCVCEERKNSALLVWQGRPIASNRQLINYLLVTQGKNIGPERHKSLFWRCRAVSFKNWCRGRNYLIKKCVCVQKLAFARKNGSSMEMQNLSEFRLHAVERRAGGKCASFVVLACNGRTCLSCESAWEQTV